MSLPMIFAKNGSGDVDLSMPVSQGQVTGILAVAGAVALEAKLFGLTPAGVSTGEVAHVRVPAAGSQFFHTAPDGVNVSRSGATTGDLRVTFVDADANHRVFVYVR